MRVRDHVAVSTAGAALLSPWLGRGVLSPWASSILIDADHYLWFCLRQRRLNPVAAVRFFNEVDPPRHPATRLLHSPMVLLLMLVLGARRRGALPVALGMALHVATDMRHEARMEQARAAALHRDDFTCQACGARGTRIVAHVRQQPWVLPSYGTQNLITLCRTCHEAAHAHGRRSIARYARSIVRKRTGTGVGATGG
jgi:hypothetical protein